MFWRLFGIFVAIPVLDLLLLIAIGRHIGYLEMIFIVIGVGIVGAVIAEREGLNTFRRVKDELYRGNLPTDEFTDGLLVLIGAVMLIAPGLITDIIGILCLIPQSRRYIKRAAYNYFTYVLNHHLLRDRFRR